jgi:hypothetical protein
MPTTKEMIASLKAKKVETINQRNNLTTKLTALDSTIAALEAIEKFEADSSYTDKIAAVFNEEE